MTHNKQTPIRLGTLAAALGLAFLSISLLFIQSSASYSASPAGPAAADAAGPAHAPGRVTIPAAALPPFDPAATRITEREGILIVQLAAGDSRQDLHILPDEAGRKIGSVQVFHADHGQLMSLRIEDGCRDQATGPRDTTTRRPPCGRFAA